MSKDTNKTPPAVTKSPPPVEKKPGAFSVPKYDPPKPPPPVKEKK
jgi:hypothetical protein